MNARLSDPALWAATLIHSRRTTLPRRLGGPGPNAAEKAAILEAASAAPDHEQLLPWRFVEVPAHRRADLGAAFEAALLERDPEADPQARSRARDKADRAPWLLVAVVRTGGEPVDIGAGERILSAGAAIQNMLLSATAMGLGSGLTSGKALQSSTFRQLLGLCAQETALCCLNFGHIIEPRKPRPRPEVARYYAVLD